MKNVSLFLFALFINICCFSQDSLVVQPLKLNSLGCEAGKFIGNTFAVEYERLINNDMGLHIEGGLTIKMNEYEEVVGGLAEIQYRIYSIVQDNVKFYFAPFAKFQYIDYKTYSANYPMYDNTVYPNDRDIYRIWSGGFLLGMKISISNRMFLDFNMGGGVKYTYNHRDLDEKFFGVQRLGYSGIFPQGNISFGVLF